MSSEAEEPGLPMTFGHETTPPANLSPFRVRSS